MLNKKSLPKSNLFSAVQSSIPVENIGFVFGQNVHERVTGVSIVYILNYIKFSINRSLTYFRKTLRVLQIIVQEKVQLLTILKTKINHLNCYLLMLYKIQTIKLIKNQL